MTHTFHRERGREGGMMKEREREEERKKDRQTDRQRERQKQRERERDENRASLVIQSIKLRSAKRIDFNISVQLLPKRRHVIPYISCLQLVSFHSEAPIGGNKCFNSQRKRRFNCLIGLIVSCQHGGQFHTRTKL